MHVLTCSPVCVFCNNGRVRESKTRIKPLGQSQVSVVASHHERMRDVCVRCIERKLHNEPLGYFGVTAITGVTQRVTQYTSHHFVVAREAEVRMKELENGQVSVSEPKTVAGPVEYIVRQNRVAHERQQKASSRYVSLLARVFEKMPCIVTRLMGLAQNKDTDSHRLGEDIEANRSMNRYSMRVPHGPNDIVTFAAAAAAAATAAAPKIGESRGISNGR